MQTIQDAKILVVDDNRELRNLIKEELTGAGYRAVRMADSAAAARQAISGELPELVILDINLPDGDGFSLFREIRGRSDIPILFLSARDADGDRLFGLGLGADDYMTKPFLMQELLLRISGILRRAYRGQLQRETALRLGERTVELSDATVSSAGGYHHADGDGTRHSAKAAGQPGAYRDLRRIVRGGLGQRLLRL